MSKKAIEIEFKGTPNPITSYDSTKINVGSLIKFYTGVTAADIYAGPARIGLGRPMETSTIPCIYPHSITYSNTIDWVFYVSNAAAAATRQVVFYEYNKNTSAYTWKGFITMTYPTATAHTARGIRAIRELYTVGSVSGSTTAIAGSGTTWQADRLCVGSRIGFGSTNPTQISVWYQISAINSDTSITLTSSAGSISTGTPYVIEDLRILTSTTNATVANGGLFITKGLRIEDFAVAGTSIPAATTVDNIKAVYWLADASIVTNTAATGVAIEEKVSWQEQRAYVLNVATVSCFVYNIRAALTLTSGKDTTTNIIKTGNQAVTGTISSANNGRIATLNHGPGSGVPSLYFVTTTRIYRAAISNILAASTTWQSDFMTEVPPGGSATYPLTSTLSSVEVSQTLDRLIIMNTGAASARSYVTQYNVIGNPMDHIFLVDDKQYDQSSADSGGVVHPSIQATVFSSWCENGILHLARHGTTSLQNQLYSLPIGAHWTYTSTTNEVLITSAIDTTDVSRFYKFYINDINTLGSATFSLQPEPYKEYYRTTGIADNTGSWNEVTHGDLSNITPSSQIQFKFEFRILGGYCIPARLKGISLTYEDNTTDSHYMPSVNFSVITGNTFAYRQDILWNSNIPNLRIRLYNAVTAALVLDDNVNSSALGTWQYSTNNGSSWLSWNATGDVVGNYIRYTASSLPSSIRIKALLTQA